MGISNITIISSEIITSDTLAKREMRTKMFNFFKKKKKETFSIVFCDTNDASTAFHTFNDIYDTYEAADHIIRMLWHKTKDQKINDGYRVDDAWIVIKKNL